MKQIWIVLLLASYALTISAQEARVEKSVFGIQTGFWGVWGYNESRIGTQWALRSEVGLFDYFGLIEGFNLEPVLTVEPRWYFNLNGRQARGKKIENNSGSFIAFRTSLRPDVFDIPVVSNDGLINPSIAFVPYFGVRKPIGEKFNYELGFGLGGEYFSKGWEGYEEGFYTGNGRKFVWAFNIHMRFGLNL